MTNPYTKSPPITDAPRIGEDIFLRTIWSGVGISLAFLIVRLYARWRNFKKLWVDDAFVIFAWLLALLTAIDWQLVAQYMYQFKAVTRGKLWPPPPNFVEHSEKYYRGSVVVNVFFYTSLWAVKFSFLLFFRRLGENVSGWHRTFFWSVLGVTIATYLVCLGDIHYSCLTSPLSKLAQRCSTKSAVHFQLVTLKINCAADVVTDYMIMAIPIGLLWTVQMSLRKKLALMGIFSLAVITTIFAIVRITSVSKTTHHVDASWLYMWNSIEVSVAIIVACLASFRSLFTDRKTRIPDPNQRSTSIGSGSLFLRRITRVLPASPTLELASIFKSSGKSQGGTMMHDEWAPTGWKRDIESAREGSAEHIMVVGKE